MCLMYLYFSAAFNDETYRYDPETVQKKGDELKEKMCRELQLLFNELLRKIRIRATERFEALVSVRV